MIEHSLYDLYFASRSWDAIPLLNIEEILSSLLLKEPSELTKEQKQDLSEGIKFLEMVLEGRRIAEHTKTTGEVGGNPESLNAFHNAHKALRKYLDNQPNLTFVSIITTAKKVLSRILEADDQKIREVTEDDIELSRKLFLLMSKEQFLKEGKPERIFWT